MRSNTAVRKLAFGGLSGVLATLSFAAVASAAPAGGGQQAVTSLPDVVSAAVVLQPSLTAAAIPSVAVCFDSPIAAPVAAKFTLVGADVASNVVPTTADLVPSALSCVSLSYPAGTNVAGFTTVEVQTGAVSPAGGAVGTNPQGAVALTGGDVAPGPGRISGPNLTGATVAGVAGGTDVTYTFDKLITAASVDFTSFGFYSPAGTPVFGTAAGGIVSDRSVKVHFLLPVLATSRVFVLANAVTLAGQPADGNASTATSGAGGAAPATLAPDLVSVTKVPSLQATYDLTYDGAISSTAGLAVNCEADTPTGKFPGTAAAVQGGSTIRVTFGGLAASSGADAEVVRINDNGGCATASPLVFASSVGAAAIRNKDHSPGFTSGPDLTGCSASAGSPDVTYSFDELLTTGTVTGPGFGLIGADGTATQGTVLQVSGNQATIRYASTGVLLSAVGCTVTHGAVTDRQPGGAEPSAMGTVLANSTGTPEPTGAPLPGVVPPGTTPPANTPKKAFKPLAARSLSASVRCHTIAGGKVSCTTKGTLAPATVLLQFGKKAICVGNVKATYTSHGKTLSAKSSKLSSKCTYTKTVTFKASKSQRKTLKVRARYAGNAISAAKSSKTITAKVR